MPKNRTWFFPTLLSVPVLAGCAASNAATDPGARPLPKGQTCTGIQQELRGLNRALRDFNRNEYLLENDTPQMVRQRLNALRKARLEKRC